MQVATSNLAESDRIRTEYEQAQTLLAQRTVDKLDRSGEAKVKMSTTLSQHYPDSLEVPDMDQGKINALYRMFHAIFGPKRRPPPDANPTPGQVTAFEYVLRRGISGLTSQYSFHTEVGTPNG